MAVSRIVLPSELLNIYLLSSRQSVTAKCKAAVPTESRLLLHAGVTEVSFIMCSNQHPNSVSGDEDTYYAISCAVSCQFF